MICLRSHSTLDLTQEGLKPRAICCLAILILVTRSGGWETPLLLSKNPWKRECPGRKHRRHRRASRAPAGNLEATACLAVLPNVTLGGHLTLSGPCFPHLWGEKPLPRVLGQGPAKGT